MTSKSLSEHAQVAQLIRAELKALGITGAKVSAKAFSLGTSVTINTIDLSPKQAKAVEDAVMKYQSYDNNWRNDIPQVKYVNINKDFSESLTEKAYKILTPENTIGLGFDHLPETFAEVGRNYDLRLLVDRILLGKDSCNFFSKELWSSAELCA